MKTNQLMNIAFSSGNVQVFHKTAMGDLTQLWKVGNAMRMSEGKSFLNMATFLQTEKFKEYLSVCESENEGRPCFLKTGRGKSSRTWASIHVLVFAAEHLSAKFHYEVIDMFINNKILEYRDVSGNEFKALNIAIDNYLPDREGKDNKQIYINVARAMRSKVGLKLPSWNEATAEQLRARGNVENQLTTMLKLGVVKDYDHMMSLLERIKA